VDAGYQLTAAGFVKDIKLIDKTLQPVKNAGAISSISVCPPQSKSSFSPSAALHLPGTPWQGWWYL